ncbi:hypothetical protein scyTo_0018257 [Scyliorhinus torazame]|uniref:VWFD domain-containing protein n=1 Tax=Scyliorhinus torazame TaxID=75743 RepID=A0A401PRM3_SCYTO|nr:hypothetical protein [Scyliorhinus torazame]
MECPCYLNGSVYKPGDKTPSPLLANNQICVCSGAEIKCSEKQVYPREHCTEDEIYAYCTNDEPGKVCEPSCESQSSKYNCPIICEDSCICKPGLVRSPEGNCIKKTQCPCMHMGTLYSAREVFRHDCNVCTCQSGVINCTAKDCSKICVTYGESHYVLYDDIWLEYESNYCDILLTESIPHVTQVPFRVQVKNAACTHFGNIICKKNVNITVGDVSLILDNMDAIMSHFEQPNYPFRISYIGFYVIIETAVGLTVYWDLHMQVLIQIKDHLMLKVVIG